MITFFTLVLDGQPWLGHHYPQFCRLNVPWRWIVVEGVADNVACTSWCAKLAPRLSNDGTTEYLDYLAAMDKRVTVLRQPIWPGKVAMCNAALELIKEPCLLWQVDADELWQFEKIEQVFSTFFYHPDHNAAMFMCYYFVGPDRYIRPDLDVYGNHTAYEWRRVWRYTPGMTFESHEPPVIKGIELSVLDQAFWKSREVVFDHMAMVVRSQVEFRSRYYAGANNPNAHLWRDCLQGWERLQQAKLPCKLKDYLPWVDDKATVVHV